MSKTFVILGLVVLVIATAGLMVFALIDMSQANDKTGPGDEKLSSNFPIPKEGERGYYFIIEVTPETIEGIVNQLNYPGLKYMIVKECQPKVKSDPICRWILIVFRPAILDVKTIRRNFWGEQCRYMIISAHNAARWLSIYCQSTNKLSNAHDVMARQTE